MAPSDPWIADVAEVRSSRIFGTLRARIYPGPGYTRDPGIPGPAPHVRRGGPIVAPMVTAHGRVAVIACPVLLPVLAGRTAR